jgi:hypothetical protein
MLLFLKPKSFIRVTACYNDFKATYYQPLARINDNQLPVTSWRWSTGTWID